jgi:hypothetical protein
LKSKEDVLQLPLEDSSIKLKSAPLSEVLRDHVSADVGTFVVAKIFSTSTRQTQVDILLLKPFF